ncbi:LSU ribosomal protein L21E [Haloarcula quadrata]|jgi:large subunit ribosomal protein L21e|uniref:Large ribosomal subunit protein eL21 n=6 Tax=Haloarcula TaxID=2237 RepID=RL21_HALMA|nr:MULTISPECIES: 50S ribosomal protein L21e [Haloarcula]P12734.2 RecName: Full=Large ribosomal subunit protein eL21; AltName: Full=50S ribosomal protein L21e; AltName: Full=Hl31 [Haloarcula marismortui ATCC 43049]1S72_Q Chain Q, 50S ribosomal protein L21e [Haloarcula marismortui]1VQ4_Q Chain Q, 50S ribosomal protein L21e [Haloarcula marismortui]1VQ5_Q Chain Q, 50S ribosomal protein L21e [Haloarcula marismortui]1VQ6_Q Chain Q, 50S ribosomal protein L21e [Haloarcula marismortui]1VQ7_Q Chain Q, 
MPSSNGPLEGTRGKLKNKPRDRGTSPPQRAVEEFDDGEKVHLKIDPSVPNGRFHPRFDGQTGTVEGKQGDAYKVDIVDGGKEKTIIVTAAHLRRQE